MVGTLPNLIGIELRLLKLSQVVLTGPSGRKILVRDLAEILNDRGSHFQQRVRHRYRLVIQAYLHVQRLVDHFLLSTDPSEFLHRGREGVSCFLDLVGDLPEQHPEMGLLPLQPFMNARPYHFRMELPLVANGVRLWPMVDPLQERQRIRSGGPGTGKDLGYAIPAGWNVWLAPLSL